MGWTYLRRAMDEIPASCPDQANEWGHIVETGPTSGALVDNVAFVWRRLEWRAIIINQVRRALHHPISPQLAPSNAGSSAASAPSPRAASETQSSSRPAIHDLHLTSRNKRTLVPGKKRAKKAYRASAILLMLGAAHAHACTRGLSEPTDMSRLPSMQRKSDYGASSECSRMPWWEGRGIQSRDSILGEESVPRSPYPLHPRSCEIGKLTHVECKLCGADCRLCSDAF